MMKDCSERWYQPTILWVLGWVLCGDPDLMCYLETLRLDAQSGSPEQMSRGDICFHGVLSMLQEYKCIHTVHTERRTSPTTDCRLFNARYSVCTFKWNWSSPFRDKNLLRKGTFLKWISLFRGWDNSHSSLFLISSTSSGLLPLTLHVLLLVCLSAHA